MGHASIAAHVLFELGRDRARLDDRIAPVVKAYELGEQLGAEAVRVTREPVDDELLLHRQPPGAGVASQRYDDDATERLAALGLTARQYNYLSVIYVEESVTPNEIGTLIHTANPTVTSMLNALERDGLIVREAHPEDGRSSVVTLTPRGKTLYEKAFQLHHDPLEETMAALTTDERKKLVDVLVRLGDSFAEAGKQSKKKPSVPSS